MSHNVTIMTHACEWLVETKLFCRLVDCMQGPRQMWLDVNCDTSDMWYEMCICMGEVTQLTDVTPGSFWLSRKESHFVQCATTEWIHLTKEMQPILCVDRTVRWGSQFIICVTCEHFTRRVSPSLCTESTSAAIQQTANSSFSRSWDLHCSKAFRRKVKHLWG